MVHHSRGEGDVQRRPGFCIRRCLGLSFTARFVICICIGERGATQNHPHLGPLIFEEPTHFAAQGACLAAIQVCAWHAMKGQIQLGKIGVGGVDSDGAMEAGHGLVDRDAARRDQQEQETEEAQ